ncbi:MAG: hypothetical protein DELT_00348 [Desulfovibrio sp.]
MSTKKSTVSIANTPVQRALAKAKRSTLLILFIVGIVGGIIYKQYVGHNPLTEEKPQPQQTQQQPQQPQNQQ